MKHPLAISLPALLALLLLARPTPAEEDGDRTTARALFFEAREAFEAGELARAVELFDRSNRIYPAPTAALGLARALVADGQLVRAHETYATIAQRSRADGDNPVFDAAVADARTEQRALEARLARLVLHVRGPSVRGPSVPGPSEVALSVDGRAIPSASLDHPRFVDPGRHVLEATAHQHRPARRVVVVTEGGSQEVWLTLEALREVPDEEPPPPLPPVVASDDRGLLIAGGSLSALSLLAFGGAAVTGGLYLGKRAFVKEHCQPSGDAFVCDDPGGPDAAHAARALGVANAVLLASGAASAIAGVTLLGVGLAADAEVNVGLDGLWLRGRF